MSAVLARSVARNFERALRLMEAALTDCPDRLWETDLWPIDAITRRFPQGGLHGSATWFLGYHALTCLDYDLLARRGPGSRNVAKVAAGRRMLEAVYYILRDGEARFLTVNAPTAA